MRVVLTGNTCFKIANFREGLIRALRDNGHELVVLAPGDEYQAMLEEWGCRVRDLPMDRNGISPISELGLLRNVFSFLRSERPDFVFSYTIKNNIYAGLACRWLGIPFVPNVTGLGPAFNDKGLINRIVRLLYKQSFAKAHTVFFQNSSDLATFVNAGLVRKSRARLLPGSGVNLQRFVPSPSSATGDSLTFLLVARLLWDKGVGIYAEAASRMHEAYPEARFQLLGPIDRESRSAVPIEQVEEWVREGTIEYLGQTNDVRSAFQSADCIVLPSWYREGMPRVLLEAAASGRPAITTDMPGCRNAIAHERTGLLCAPKDAEALTETMKKFAAMTGDERASMGKAARARAEELFDEQIVIDAYASVLSSFAQ